MQTEISEYINLEGLAKRKCSAEKKNRKYVVKHDEIHVCGRGIIEGIIERNKNR